MKISDFGFSTSLPDNGLSGKVMVYAYAWYVHMLGIYT